MTNHRRPARSPRSGLAQGGLGGPPDQLLEDGQEEVFARSEVESGNIEHQAAAGGTARPEGEAGADERSVPRAPAP